MKFDPIVDEFFETKPDLLAEIKMFEKRRGLFLLKKLKRDKNEVNFFSWLSEVRFGLFFDEMSQDLKNDHLVEGKRPDWLIVMNGQKILAEVLRLNTPEEEYKNSIHQNRLLRKFQKDHPGVPIVTGGPVKTIDLSTLGGGEFKMTAKEEKYRLLIQKHQFPFILCVAPTIDTFLFELDFSDFLSGDRGFFSRNKSFGSNVTGVLLHTPFNQFFYYPNEAATFPLLEINKDLLRPYFYGND